MAQTEAKLDGCSSLDEALDRVRVGAAPAAGRWLRGYGWRERRLAGRREPTHAGPRRDDRYVPAALIAKDYHSLWLNSAALATRSGDLEVAGGVVERDSTAASRRAILREEAAWQFKDRHLTVPDDEYVEAMRAGLKLAHCARRHRGPRQGRLARRAPALAAARARATALTLRVWQSIPHEQVASARRSGLRSGFGEPHVRLGYLKVFMDGTLGSQTARMLDGTRRADHERRAASRDRPPWRRAPGSRSRCTRSAIAPTARRSTPSRQTRDVWQPLGLRQRIEHAQLLAPEDLPRFAALGVACSVQFSHAPSDRDLADRFWADKTDGAYAFRSLLDSGAVVANGSDAPIEELDPLAGIRAGVRRTIDDQPPGTRSSR